MTAEKKRAKKKREALTVKDQDPSPTVALGAMEVFSKKDREVFKELDSLLHCNACGKSVQTRGLQCGRSIC